MILISKVEKHMINGDVARVAQIEPLRMVYQEAEVPVQTMTHTIPGHRYQGVDGEPRCIGLAPDVVETLGFDIPDFLNAVEDLRKLRLETIELAASVGNLKSVVCHYRAASLWTRIKWVFGGVK